MAEKIFLQESKEYQLKIDVARSFGNAPEASAPTDEALLQVVLQALRQAVGSLAGKGKSKVTANEAPWRRDGIRYDTADRRLKANNLTLAIEAADKRTKLKYKQHHFIPEMLFGKPERAMVYPDIRAAGIYKKHETTLKIEQDIHLDNIKYCASGSLYLKGHQTNVQDTAFFSRFYPGLSTLFAKPVALQAVSHWDETIFDDMCVRWDGNKIDTWMLVTRRNAQTQGFIESELSFKVVKPLDDEWDRRELRDAARLYLALKNTGLFMELPPIFTFGDPVYSIDIVKAPEGVPA